MIEFQNFIQPWEEITNITDRLIFARINFRKGLLHASRFSPASDINSKFIIVFSWNVVLTTKFFLTFAPEPTREIPYFPWKSADISQNYADLLFFLVYNFEIPHCRVNHA